jgi:hypothetical protein
VPYTLSTQVYSTRYTFLIYLVGRVNLRCMRELTTPEVAERLQVGQSTVNLWCRQGRFPNARNVPTPRGPVWMIPDTDLKDFVKPQMGRPRKAKEEKPEKKPRPKRASSLKG